MSFLSVIKSIGRKVETVVGIGLKTAVAVEAAVEPVVAILDPPAAAILQKVQVVTAGLEGMITGAQQGAVKGQTAVQILSAEIPQLQEVITAAGSNAKIPQEKIQALVNDAVALFNSLAAITDGFKSPPPVAVKPPAAD